MGKRSYRGEKIVACTVENAALNYRDKNILAMKWQNDYSKSIPGTASVLKASLYHLLFGLCQMKRHLQILILLMNYLLFRLPLV